MNWQRARNTTQIDQRRQKLMEMASTLLDEMDYQEISLAMVAERAGIAKSGVYRYFESKEMIYLRVWLADLEELVCQLERELAPCADQCAPKPVAEIMVKNVVDRPRFWNLLAVTASLLERNLSFESLIEIKTESLYILLRLSNALKAAFPSLSMEKIQQAQIGFSHLLIAGWYAAHPPKILSDLHKRPEFTQWNRDAIQDMSDMFSYLLAGLLADSDSHSS